MNLHPASPLAVLQRILRRHRDDLGLVHGSLERAIQDTCAVWVPKFPNLYEVDSNVLASDIRQNLVYYLKHATNKPAVLKVGTGLNCSAALSDGNADSTLVRKHPRHLATARLLQPTEYPAETLFGENYSIVSWLPYVLWEPDLKRQSLAGAWLAAISNIDHPEKVTLYDRIDLPPAIMPLMKAPPPPSEDEDWDEWRNKKGDGPPSPA